MIIDGLRGWAEGAHPRPLEKEEILGWLLHKDTINSKSTPLLSSSETVIRVSDT
jgi:hypothetical protein